MSIVLVSGSQKGADVVVDIIDRAVLTGIERGLLKAFDIYEPEVAMKTGALRRALRLSLERTIRASIHTGQDRIVIQEGDIQNFTEALLFYAKYHFNEGPTGLSDYIDPFTANTHPINLRKLKRIAIPLIKKEIIDEMRNRGAETGSGGGGGPGSPSGGGGISGGAIGVGVAIVAAGIAALRGDF